ncbi:MAG: Mu transposase C-terminal domain-containing protein [Phycisphaerae bacterium]
MIAILPVNSDDAMHAAPAAAIAVAPYTGPHTWYRLPDVALGLGETGDALEKRWQRFAREELPAEQRDKRGGAWVVRGDALIVDRHGEELQVATLAQRLRAIATPAAVLAGRDSSRQRHAQLAELLSRDRAFRQQHPQLAPFSQGYFDALARVHGEWAREHALPMSRSKIIELRGKAARGEPLDGRIRSGRKRVEIDARLVERVRGVYLHPNRFGGADAFHEQERLAAELGIAPLSQYHVRSIIAEIPRAVRVLEREGPRAFEMRCVPKDRIDYTHVPAGAWYSCDARVADVRIADPAAEGGYRRGRAVVVGFCCARSGRLIVGVALSEDGNAYLRVLRDLVAECGAPSDITYDNGKALKRAFGSPRGTWLQRVRFGDGRLGGVLHELAIRGHVSTPYAPWAKKIEAIWRFIKQKIDRLFPGFWGGCPAERSHVAAALDRDHPELLPTFDEFSRAVRTGVEVYNSTPRRALGGLTPNLVFEQQRGTIRRVDLHVLALACRPLDGPRKVGRDHVTYRGLRYELDAGDAVKLQGREVYIRPDIDRVGEIVLADANGRNLCSALHKALVRADATPEALAAASAKKSRFRRAVKAAVPARNYLQNETPQQVLEAQREFRKSREAAQCKALPTPAAPAVALVRPDLVEPAKKVTAQADRQRRAAKGAAPAAVAFDGFAVLAEQEEIVRRQEAGAGRGFAEFAECDPETPGKDAGRFSWADLGVSAG